MATSLNSLEVVSFIYAEYRAYWKDQCKINHDRFLKLINLENQDHAAISRTLNKKGSLSRPILRALDDETSQLKLAQALNTPGIFSCTSYGQLRSILDSVSTSETNTEHPARLWKINASIADVENLQLSQGEEACVESIKQLLGNAASPVAYWKAEFYSGASVCAYVLGQEAIKSGSYDCVYFAQASSIVNPFNYELQKLACDLGVEQSVGNTGTKLFNKLASIKALLIICNSNLIPESQSNKRYSIVHGLLNEAVHKVRGWSGLTHLKLFNKLASIKALLIICNSNLIPESQSNKRYSIVHGLLNEAVHKVRGWSGLTHLLLVGPELKFDHSGKDITNLVGASPLLTSSKQPRIEFFSSQLSRFCGIRNSSNVIVNSTRHKRVKWHYKETVTNEGWPVNVRIRAFFASNYETYAYFDATRGFNELAGSLVDKLPIDITLFKNDIQLEIDRLKSKKNNTEIRLLRFFSTALYWLTRDTLIELVKNDNNLNVKQISDLKLYEGIHDLRNTIRIIEPDNNNDLNCDAYVLSLGIKSIIQDDWITNSPVDRSLAHWRIADRLYTLQHSKSQLLKELPFVPHWGRTRIYLLAETFRHLIRSTEHSKHTIDKNYDSSGTLDFPPRPTEKLNGSDRRIIFNYCFQILYRTEINGNQDAIHSGSLSKRHGAYHLAAELIEMLCLDNDLSIPNPYLDDKFHLQLQRDASFALIDLGETSKAINVTSQRLIGIDNKTDALKQFDAYLDLALINTTMGDLDQADQNIAKATKNLNRIKGEMNDPDSSLKTNWSMRSREKRVKAREAHILYLRGHNSEAIKYYETLDKKSIRDEIAHCYIAALGARGEFADIQQATAICLSNMFDLTSKGHQHNALGFRIALAHLFRKLDMYEAAETCLDQVLLDILEFGCAERTYQSFLLEAGRILTIGNRPAKAFAIYLRPGLLRAQQSKIQRTTQSFIKTSIQSLDLIKEQQANYGSINSWKDYLRSELQPQDVFKERITPKTVGFFSTDPLASIDLNTDLTIIDFLSDPVAIQNEIAKLDRLLCEPKV